MATAYPLFDDSVEKYGEKYDSEINYPIRDWVNQVWETIYDSLQHTSIATEVPKRFTISGSSEGEPYWFFDVMANDGLGDGDLIFLTPNKFIRNTRFTFFDFIGREETFKISEHPKYKNDAKFFESVKGQYTPKVIVRKPESEGSMLLQELKFVIPLSGNYMLSIIGIFHQKETLLTKIKSGIEELIPEDSLLDERYVVRLNEVQMEITPPERGQTFVGDYRGIQLRETVPVLVITLFIDYIDEVTVRPGGEEMKKAGKHFNKEKS